MKIISAKGLVCQENSSETRVGSAEWPDQEGEQWEVSSEGG